MAVQIDETKVIAIKKGGLYYNVSGNDALIFNKYMGYNLYGVYEYRTGFPVYHSESILERFDDFSINYDVYDKNGNIIISKRFPRNFYEIIDSCDYQLKDKSKKKISKISTFSNNLQALSEGINPHTGELIAGFDDELKNDMFELLMYFHEKEKRQKETKTKFPSSGKRWTPEEDEMLIQECKEQKYTIKELSEMHGRSTSAIKGRMFDLKLLDME